MSAQNYISHVNKKAGVPGISGDEKRRMYGQPRDSATRRRRMTDLLKSMTDEELLEGSKEKAPNKCATEFAIKCQKELWSRHH